MLLTDSAAILIRQAQAAETRSSWLPNLKLNYQADIGTSNNTTRSLFLALVLSPQAQVVFVIPALLLPLAITWALQP